MQTLVVTIRALSTAACQMSLITRRLLTQIVRLRLVNQLPRASSAAASLLVPSRIISDRSALVQPHRYYSESSGNDGGNEDGNTMLNESEVDEVIASVDSVPPDPAQNVRSAYKRIYSK